MKKMLLLAILALFSSSTFALSLLTCNAQMLGKTQYSPRSFVAPALVSQSKDSLISAKHSSTSLYLNFKAETISTTQAYLILDGRYKNILMNSHLSVSENSGIISLQLRDTISGKTQAHEFFTDTEFTISFDNGNALLEMDCKAN